MGKYQYMPDKSWNQPGTCTDKIGEDKRYNSWEEGSHLKEYTYKITGGTGGHSGAAREHVHLREPIGHHRRRHL